MIKRTIVFTSQCRVSLKNGQLIVENHETGEQKKSPVEDLGIVLIENQQVSITVPALNALSANNCAVVFCDSKHMPSSMLMPLESNSVQGERYRDQVEASLPLKKGLWKKIVQMKIRNQSSLLTKIGRDGGKLKPFYTNVKSGDSDNREGIAAKIYWDELFGDEFVRSRTGPDPNALLNYGYSILRAAMARAIIGSGLSPSFGLFHKNRYNAFPLADDLMEPYRPYVDAVVYQLRLEDKKELDSEVKQRLLCILFADTVFEDCTRPLEIGLSMTTASLARCYSGEGKILVLPIF